MRLWFAGPRLFGGFLRPGVSFNVGRRSGLRPSAPAGNYVYVAQSAHGHVKIGFSNNPAARLASLQTGSPFPISIVWQEFAGDRAFDIEQQAHAILAPHRMAGEWFDVPKEAAVAAIFGAAYRLGIELNGAPVVLRPRFARWQIFLATVVIATFASAILHSGIAAVAAVLLGAILLNL